jgi:hypothetical protein
MPHFATRGAELATGLRRLFARASAKQHRCPINSPHLHVLLHTKLKNTTQGKERITLTSSPMSMP